MGPVTFALGLACVLAAVCTLIGRDQRRDTDDALVVIGLVYVWAFGAMVQMIGAEFWPEAFPPLLIWIAPPIDLAFGAYVARLHKSRPSAWKRLTLVLVGFQLVTHVLFGLSDKNPASLYAYKCALNLSFLAQIACVMTPGGRIAVGRLRALFSGVPPRVRVVRSRTHGG